MPDPEAPVESRKVPDAITARIAIADLNELLRNTLQLSGVRPAAGLPRRLSPEIAARWFSGPHVLLALSSRTHFDELAAFAAFPVEQALALVDRALGGPGKGYVAGPAGAPSEAEFGVLAYLAARCVRICAPNLRVSDVRLDSKDDLAPWLDRAVLWPVQVALASTLALDLKLVFVERKHVPPWSQPVRLCVREATDWTSLEAPCVGDLLVFETWPFTLTSQGPSGVLELEAEGIREKIALAATGNRIATFAGASVTVGESAATLIVHETTLDFWELSGLAAGVTTTLPELWKGPARVVVGGRVAAGGKLARYAGQLALRVDETYSIR